MTAAMASSPGDSMPIQLISPGSPASDSPLTVFLARVLDTAFFKAAQLSCIANSIHRSVAYSSSIRRAQ